MAVGCYLNVLAGLTRSVAIAVGRRGRVFRRRPRESLLPITTGNTIERSPPIEFPMAVGSNRMATPSRNWIRTSRGVEEFARMSAAMMITASLHPKRHVWHGVRRRWRVVILGVLIFVVGWVATVVGLLGSRRVAELLRSW